MSLLDRRHKWGPVVRDGARITRTCSACGRTTSYETLVPDAVVNDMLTYAARANPYRALFR